MVLGVSRVCLVKLVVMFWVLLGNVCGGVLMGFVVLLLV